jgi:hypothetical protein
MGLSFSSTVYTPFNKRDKSNMQLTPRIGWTHKSRMPLSWHKRQLAVACYEKKYAWSGQWWLFFYLWQSNICSLQSCLFTCGNQTFVHMFFPLLPFYLWQSNNCSYVLPSPVFLPVAIKHLFICSSQSCVFTCGNQTFVHVLPSPVLLPVAIKHLFISSSQSCLFTCGNNTFVHMFFSVLSFYLWQ